MSALLPLALALRLAAVGDPGFDRIVARVGQQSHDVSCAQMKAWVDQHPKDPNAGRGLVWMAELRLIDHHTDLAMPLLERAAHGYPDTEWGHQAEKSLADLLVGGHHYAAAIAIYEKLSKLPTDYWQYVGRMAAASAREQRTRWEIFLALVAALLAGIGYRIARARRQLWPLPDEVIYALPIALVMLAAAWAQSPEEAHAVVSVALGGMLLLYAHGVHLRSVELSWRTRLVESVVGLGEAAALLYCAVVANGLWLKFSETVLTGAER